MVQTLKADIIINIYIKRANVNNGKIFSSGLNAIYMYILQTRMYRNKN